LETVSDCTDVEGTCQHVIPARFKRTGMRWKQQGFLNVLEH